MFKCQNLKRLLYPRSFQVQNFLTTTNKNNFSLFKLTPLAMKFSTQQVAQNNSSSAGKPKEEDELKPAPFIPLERMGSKKIFAAKRDNLKETFYYFGNEKAKLAEKNYNVMEFYSKKLRRDYIRSGELDSHKYIIPVKRLRTKADTIEKLRKNQEMAAVIEGREEFSDVDIVIDRRFVDKLQKKKFYYVRPYFIKLGNDLIRCTLAEKQKEMLTTSYYKLRFQRYIVGRPNLLTLQLKLVGRHLNEMLSDFDLELAQLYHQVDVWVCTDDYPPIIEIDCRLFLHKKPFKFVDLIKILPEGMWLHRKYDSLMYQSIVTLGENYNLLLASNNFPVVDPDDPEGEKADVSIEELLSPGKSIDPQLRAEILKQISTVDINDENAHIELIEELRTILGIEGEKVEEIDLEAEKEEPEEHKEYEGDREENEEDEEGGARASQSKKLANEEKINEILSELSKRKVAPKGAVMPLSAASSKKLMANKVETNTTSSFKKAQAKGSAPAKKDGKKK